MGYTCKECGQEHRGFPAMGFAMPHSCQKMSSEEFEEKVAIDDRFCIVKNGNKIDYYVYTIWPQRIKDTKTGWHFKVWVKIPELTMEKLKDVKDGMRFHGSLQSVLIWWDENTLGYPVQVRYIEEIDELAVEGVLPMPGIFYDTFVNGIPLDLALDRRNDVMKKADQFRCEHDVIENRIRK